MSELSYGQLIDAKFRFYLKERYPTTSSFLYPNQFMIDQIESILETHPELRAFNYHQLSINALISLVKKYINDVKVYHSIDDEVLILEASPTKSFLTMKEFLVLFILSSLNSISLFHLIFSKKKLETLKCKDYESFAYIYENSAAIKNEDKLHYHFVSSIFSIVNHIYLLPDEFIKRKTLLPKLPNKFGNDTIADYIENNHQTLNVEDALLTKYLINLPQNIDAAKLSQRKNSNKL